MIFKDDLEFFGIFVAPDEQQDVRMLKVGLSINGQLAVV
jgi:hypothetical protein